MQIEITEWREWSAVWKFIYSHLEPSSEKKVIVLRLPSQGPFRSRFKRGQAGIFQADISEGYVFGPKGPVNGGWKPKLEKLVGAVEKIGGNLCDICPLLSQCCIFRERVLSNPSHMTMLHFESIGSEWKQHRIDVVGTMHIESANRKFVTRPHRHSGSTWCWELSKQEIAISKISPLMYYPSRGF